MFKALLLTFLVTIDINVSNFINEYLRYAFDPYTSMFGNFTWGIIFGFVGAALYVGSKSIPTVFTYLALIGLIFAIILPWGIFAIFGLILVFIGTTAFYVLLIDS